MTAGLHVLHDGPDLIFARALRGAYSVDVRDDDRIVVINSGEITLVLAHPGLILRFLPLGGGEASVLPCLVTTDPSQSIPWGDDHAQAAIDALGDLIFRRCTPSGTVQ